jgi:uncharacterized protein YbcV (DUF1398 family)
MNTEVIHKTLAATEAGELTFPQVVGTLLDIGIESYFVDLVRADDTFYSTDGKSHVETMQIPAAPVAQTFNQADLVGALRAAQADQIRYPEFVRRARAAGAVAYWAFLTGKQVLYFGHKGECHVEKFPGT